MSSMTEDDFDLLLDKLVKMRGLTVDAATRGQWWETLQDMEPQVFAEAVRRVIQEDEAYPSPAHVRRICGDVMRERLDRAAQPVPPSGLSAQEYLSWNKEWRRQIVRGAVPEDAAVQAVEATKKPAVNAVEAGKRPAIESIILPKR